FLVRLRRQMGSIPSNWRGIGALLRPGLVMIPMGYAHWIIHASDRMFTANMMGLAPLGAYAAGYNVAHMFAPLFMGPLWSMYPARATPLHEEGNTVGFALLTRRTEKFMFFLMIPAT